jgi:hypothetical protein
MTYENLDKAKADVKKGIADAEKAGAYVKAGAKADVEKVKASFGKSDVQKNVAYAKADVNEAIDKAKADVKNKTAHAKADLEKSNAEIRR